MKINNDISRHGIWKRYAQFCVYLLICNTININVIV